nr:DUF1772 domain-containing protein [Ktedonobacteraceae bacterium]
MNTMVFHTLIFLNIASAGLVTGGAAVMAAAYLPLLATLSSGETITVHQGIGRYIDRWQPKLAMLALFTGLAELLFTQHLWQTVAVVLGVAGIFALSLISRAVSIPLSRRIVAWTPPTSEVRLDLMKAQWIRAHYIRSAFALGGFLCFIVSVLLLVQF